jgi:antibiotic biosynthesis monooxygenase (ABM) superfamily enzyme
MDDTAPIVEIRARFVDEVVAREVAEALNAWFRWIVEGSPMPPPPVLESLGVETAAYAWSLGEDVDWELGPHARALGPEVRIALQTRDTHLHLSGLLRGMGALAVHLVRDQP